MWYNNLMICLGHSQFEDFSTVVLYHLPAAEVAPTRLVPAWVWWLSGAVGVALGVGLLWLAWRRARTPDPKATQAALLWLWTVAIWLIIGLNLAGIPLAAWLVDGLRVGSIHKWMMVTLCLTVGLFVSLLVGGAPLQRQAKSGGSDE